jgi:phospholipid/cholesterol/gamma-HCH transport system substrate-binding protein
VRGSSGAGRIAAVAAIAVAAVAVVMLLRNGGEDYRVTAEFQNASQLVNGNEVLIGGLRAGIVKEIELGDDGQALVTFTVDDEFAPLPRGTVATIRQNSLSSVAGRQVHLTLPPAAQAGEEIEDGGSLSQSETVSAVDLDEVFNTLDTKTVKDFKRVVKGLRDSYEGVADRANRGFKYSNPFLSTSRRVFAELTRDTRAFESLVVDTARLSALLAARRSDLSGLVGNANSALGAIGNQRAQLAEAINRLPDFMRRANTTFVNLRAALTDLDPLVSASKPVAERLRPFFSEFRAAAADAVPTIRDLSEIVRRGGRANDLVELTRAQVPLARAGVGSGAPDCGADPASDYESAADDDRSQGSLGEAACALSNSLPQIAALRAYTPELVGWFDGFSTSGSLDASGGLGRIAATFNAFTPSTSGLVDVLDPLDTSVGDLLKGADLDFLDVGNLARCPGSLERDPGDGSTPFTDGGSLRCDPSLVPTGP